MKNLFLSSAAELHKNVPPDWYYISIKDNLFQRFWHNRRFAEIGKLIETVDGKVLDIGSADGVFTNIISKKTGAKKVIGIDVLKTSVDWANKHWKKSNMHFEIGDAHKLRFKNGEFSAVFALEVLEHVKRPDLVLKEILRILKKAGYAIFLIPTDSFLFRILWNNIWTKTRGKIWNDAHIQTYKDDRLVKMCKKAGFTLEANRKFIFGMLQAIKLRK